MNWPLPLLTPGRERLLVAGDLVRVTDESRLPSHGDSPAEERFRVDRIRFVGQDDAPGLCGRDDGRAAVTAEDDGVCQPDATGMSFPLRAWARSRSGSRVALCHDGP
jgi:hypothetical protein